MSCAKVSVMFTANRKNIAMGPEANAIMSQHVAQKSTDSTFAIMSQHVAQQSISSELDNAILYRYI